MVQSNESPYRSDGVDRKLRIGSDKCEEYVRSCLKRAFGRADAAKWIADQQLMEYPDAEGWRGILRDEVSGDLEPISLLKKFGVPAKDIPRESRAWLFDPEKSDIYLADDEAFFILTHDGDLLHYSSDELARVGPSIAKIRLGRTFEFVERMRLDLLEASVFRAWRDQRTTVEARKFLCEPYSQAIAEAAAKARSVYAAATIIRSPSGDSQLPFRMRRVVVWGGKFNAKPTAAWLCAGSQFNPDSFRHTVSDWVIWGVTAHDLLFDKTDGLWSRRRVEEVIEEFSRRGRSLFIIGCCDGEGILFAHQSELCGPSPPLGEKLL